MSAREETVPLSVNRRAFALLTRTYHGSLFMIDGSGAVSGALALKLRLGRGVFNSTVTVFAAGGVPWVLFV